MRIPKATILLLVGALASGGGAAYFTDAYIVSTVNKHVDKINAQYTPVPVVVASRNLLPGDLMVTSNVSMREVPKGFVHSDALRKADFASTKGYALAYPVNAGEPILHSHLSRKRGGKFAEFVEAGMRALTLRVDDVSSLSGMLAPNDKVDILLTIKGHKDQVTFPLLQDVLVMATGRQTSDLYGEELKKSYATVTVLLWPKDAAKVIHAQETGSITFMLRGVDSPGDMENVKVTKSTLLGKKRRSPGASVQVIIGG
jgi:pilus assembly protein CpaB